MGAGVGEEMNWCPYMLVSHTSKLIEAELRCRWWKRAKRTHLLCGLPTRGRWKNTSGQHLWRIETKQECWDSKVIAFYRVGIVKGCGCVGRPEGKLWHSYFCLFLYTCVFLITRQLCSSFIIPSMDIAVPSPALSRSQGKQVLMDTIYPMFLLLSSSRSSFLHSFAFGVLLQHFLLTLSALNAPF